MTSDETYISVPDNVPQEGDSTGRKSKPMSGSQASQLKQLASELGVPVDLGLNADDAARKIDELQKKAPQNIPEP